MSAKYPRLYCDTCPFNSDDPIAWHGHEMHAPPRGWLGEGERHTMLGAGSPEWTEAEVKSHDEWLNKLVRDEAWDEGTKAVIMRREARRLVHADATYWQRMPTAWEQIISEKMRQDTAPSIYTRLFAGETPQEIVQKIEGRFLQSRTFTRSRGRRFLEWAAAWLHYYIR